MTRDSESRDDRTREDPLREVKAIQRWAENLESVGVPVQTRRYRSTRRPSEVYYEECFDV